VREIVSGKFAEFLIFSDAFPRSIHYCMAQVDELLRRILCETGPRARTDAARTSRRLLGEMQSLTIEEIIRDGLHEFLVALQESLSRIGDEVVQTTMFYRAEAEVDEQLQQQQQQQQ
jgi:uncharacterized alpha-E superfamily protein